MLQTDNLQLRSFVTPLSVAGELDRSSKPNMLPIGSIFGFNFGISAYELANAQKKFDGEFIDFFVGQCAVS